MATDWLKEVETGRWYMNYTSPDGLIIRRYEEELQQEQSQPTYDPEPQEHPGVFPQSSTSSYHLSTRETSRFESRPPIVSTRGTRTQSISYTQPTARPQLQTRRSSRREGKVYHESRGYDKSYNQKVELDINYNDSDDTRSFASSSYQEGDEGLDDRTSHSAGVCRDDRDKLTSSYTTTHQEKGKTASLASGSRKHVFAGPVDNFRPRQIPTEPPRIFTGTGTPGTVETLDRSFKIRSNDWQTFFRCGRVFKTLWTDPCALNDGSDNDQFQSKAKYRVAYDQYVISKIRRFVVFKDNGRSCLCLPVTTYAGRGLKRKGIDIAAYGLIHNVDEEPVGVADITKRPLKMRPSKNGEKLAPNSYINYGRFYSVESNVNVKDVGELDSTSRKLLRKYCREDFFLDEDEEKEATANSYSTPSKSERQQQADDYQNDLDPTFSFLKSEVYISNDSASYQSHHNNEHGLEDPGIFNDEAQDIADMDANAATMNLDIEVVTNQHDTNSTGYTADVLTLSRLSSNSSLNSLHSTVFSAPETIGSSKSSIGLDAEYMQRFIDLLLNDLELNSLFESAIGKISFDKFESNFRRCLHVFSKHLQIEASNSLPKKMPSLVRRFSTNAAHRIRRSFEQSRRSGVYTKDTPVEDIDGPEEDEMDDLEAGAEEDEGNDETIETAILVTTSFTMLRENFRIFLISDQPQRAIFDAWPVQLALWETVEFKYLVFSGLEQFFMSRNPQQHRLRDVLALVGTDEVAEALSCEDYLLREWPDIGQCLVACVDAFLSDHLRADSRETLGECTIQLQSTNSIDTVAGIHMVVNASYRLHGQVAAASSWLSATLRLSQYQEVCRSHVSIKAMSSSAESDGKPVNNGNKVIEIRLDDLERIKSPKMCWHHIFPNNVITPGFPIKKRASGVGLEISFANLAYASRCLSFVEFDGGLIAHGLRSILIPIAELKDDDAIQWHFESKTKTTSRKPASIGQVLRVLAIENWHKVSDPAKLIKRRCFLGWVEEAHIVMGTPAYTMSLRPSGVSACASKAIIRRFEFTAGVSAMSWATLQGTVVREPVSISNSVSTSQEVDLLDILNMAADEHGTIFEPEKKIGWCIPRACIVLQMAHSIVSNCRYKLYEGERIVSQNDHRFYAQCIPDGGSSAIAALKQCFKLTIQKEAGTPELLRKEEFSGMIARNWHLLSDIAESLDSTANQLYLAGSSPSKHLLGVDVLDAVNNKRPMKVRRVEVNQPWTLLTAERPLVLFCSGISPPISAALNSTNACESCTHVPPQQNLLVATSSTVNSFLEYQNHGLADGLDWCNPIMPHLIESHVGKGNIPMQYVQKLQSKRKPLSNAAIRTAMQKRLLGAFIFGNGTEKKCTGFITYTSIRSTTKKNKDINSLSRAASSSEISSTASATSFEATNTSEFTNVSQSRHDTDSEESVDPEDIHTRDCGMGLSSRNPLGGAPDQAPSSFGGPHVIAEINKVSSTPEKTGRGAKTTTFSSTFARVRRRIRWDGDLGRR